MPPPYKLANSSTNSPQNVAHYANADSGSSGNYIALKDISCLKNIQSCPNNTGVIVQVANGQLITSNQIGQLHAPDNTILDAYIFPSINGSLISISQFVDKGFTVTYTTDKVLFIKNNNLVFSGLRDPVSRLWMIDLAIFYQNSSTLPIAPALPTYSPNTAAAVCAISKVIPLQAAPAIRLTNKEQFVRYWHACLGFPTKATLIRALKNWLSVPNLSPEAVKLHLPNIVNTALGHLDATRQNIASTRIRTPTVFDSSPRAIWIGQHEITGRVHLDAAGALPFKGRDGSKYVLIFFSEDANYIHVVRMTSRTAKEYSTAIKSALAFFKSHGVSTSTLRMDNECSEEVKQHIRAASLSLELTPASQHRRNKAERAIRSYKNHFISCLAGVDESSAVDLWSDYCDQIEETINLLRLGPAGRSAWEGLHGIRDFNKVPLAPIGIKVVAHIPPAERSSWAQHGLVGFYVGPAHEHYRCYRIWIPSTKAIRISDCCEWFPASILTATMDEKLSALPLLPPIVDVSCIDKSVCEKKEPKQRVAPTLAAPIINEPTLPPATITASRYSQLQHNKRRRAPAYYRSLSKSEINKLAKNIFNKIGKLYVDNNDPLDTSSGIIVDIVKHINSGKLQFKAYDNNIFIDGPPTNKMDYNYLNVTWAMKACQFHSIKKIKPLLATLVTQVTCEEKLANLGPTSSARRKHHLSKLEPSQIKLTNSVIATPSSALSAIDLNADGTRLTSTTALNGPDKKEWLVKYGEEIDRLILSGTGTFISRSEVPNNKKVAYYNPQLKIKMKEGKLVKRVRGTIGGDQLPFDGPTAAQTAALETIRLLLNCIVSEHALLMTLDIKDFYLGTPLDEAEYMRIPLKFIPAELQLKYNLQSLSSSEAVIMKITKSIYGLKQAGILSQQRLVDHLAKHGYMQCQFTPCLFIHSTNGTAFTLVVDDFMVKYKDLASKQHLISCLEELYQITVDTAPIQKYVGITINYNRSKQYIDLSMPGYVKKALIRFGKTGLRGVNSPMTYAPPNYGAKSQMLKEDSLTSILLNPAQTLFIQEVVGVFLYYSRAVDPLMITAINKIGSRQAGADTSILNDIDRFFQYASRWDSNVMRIHPSNMKLNVHSDASYLSETKGRSRAGAFMCMGSELHDNRPNAPILYLSVIITTVVDSATAAEYAAAFIAAQAATSLRLTLGELGYPQESTQITCDNVCAVGIANNSFTQKRSKTIDMRYHWLRDQISLGNFTINWKPGSENLADFFTKAHSVEHHLKMISLYSVVEEGVLNNRNIYTD